MISVGFLYFMYFLCSSGHNLYVCNPTTNQIVGIGSNFDRVNADDVGFNLGFDPAKSLHYQVVCVSNSNIEENSYSIDVYSSSTNQWRKRVIDPFRVPFDVEFDHGVYWEGRIHWLSNTESTIFFDFEKECVETLVLPKAIEGSYIERFRYFGESCGPLHLIEIRTNCVQEFDVLELNTENKIEWLVKFLGRGFETQMSQGHSDRFGRGFRFYAFSVLDVVRVNSEDDDDEDDSTLIISIPGKVISYSFRTKVSRLMCNVVDESDKLFPFRGHNAVQFIESLFCLS